MKRTVLTSTNQQRLDLLKEVEVSSLHYEGVVSVQEDNRVIRYGETIDFLDTNRKIKRLFKEFYDSELRFLY